MRDRLEKVVVASSMSIYGEGLYRCPPRATESPRAARRTRSSPRASWELRCPRAARSSSRVPTPETKPLHPTSVYAIKKRDHEELFLAWGRAYDVPATALRFFNVYGPRQALSNPYTGVAAIFASRLLNGRPPVDLRGRPAEPRLHPRPDIVGGIVAALEPGPGRRRGAQHRHRPARSSVLDVAPTCSPRVSASSSSPRSRSSTAPATSATASPIRPGARTARLRGPSRVRGRNARALAWLASQHAVDLVDEATEALARRGLTV